jgi:hypothetical protein
MELWLLIYAEDMLLQTMARFAGQEYPEARAVWRVEVVLVLIRIQSPEQKIRPEFFRKLWPFKSVTDLGCGG